MKPRSGIALALVASALLIPAKPWVQDARHLALYGPPQPLHLPFGLTVPADPGPVFEAALISSIVVVAALGGWFVRRMMERVAV